MYYQLENCLICFDQVYVFHEDGTSGEDEF